MISNKGKYEDVRMQTEQGLLLGRRKVMKNLSFTILIFLP